MISLEKNEAGIPVFLKYTAQNAISIFLSIKRTDLEYLKDYILTELSLQNYQLRFYFATNAIQQ